jgi:hypothetical protein
MQEDAKNILYQRSQNVWSKTSIYTLKLLSKHVKQIMKRRALQVYVVVENVENLDVGWRLFMWLCVCVVSLAVLRVRFPVCSECLVVSLYDTHEAKTSGRNWYAFLTAGRHSYVSGTNNPRRLIALARYVFVILHRYWE